MKKSIFKSTLPILMTALVFVSCSKESDLEGSTEQVVGVSAKASVKKSHQEAVKLTSKISKSTFSHDFNPAKAKLVQPSECGLTEFDYAVFEAFNNLDPLAREWFDFYAAVNFGTTIIDDDAQYFGDRGQYTNLVNKITRNLENFWNMPNEVTVRGEHNMTLTDPDKIAESLIVIYGLDPSLAVAYADFLVNYVNLESNILENPLISADGFAIALDGILGQGDLIVIGDGIIDLASSAGIDAKIAWNGIMAHEWGHQLQFNKRGAWEYPGVDLSDEAEDTRSTELEADFITGYFLTHKRGGTYNWWRAEEFLNLFFGIGDCAFTNPGHHGTPIQREAAAYQGYLLAKSAQENGKILSADEVHNAFIQKLGTIIESGPVIEPETNFQ
ncbi:hypothetical protein ACEZ3G_11150 [Maribacter algicola]|uniref:Uncharacterized protein n=1 Tax=Meishania litoralis TaxID=3434685 RepID=A0ACC7LLD0_9FLAO